MSSFSVCEDKKEAASRSLEKQFLLDYLSTMIVDKFFHFDCQKDMKNWENLARRHDAPCMCQCQRLFFQLLHGEGVCTHRYRRRCAKHGDAYANTFARVVPNLLFAKRHLNHLGEAG